MINEVLPVTITLTRETEFPVPVLALGIAIGVELLGGVALLLGYRARLVAAVKEIGQNITGVQGDAGNLADLDRLYDTVKAKKGQIDILHGSEGPAADAGRRLDHHDRLHRRREGLPA